jgi:hypothetical protein
MKCKFVGALSLALISATLVLAQSPLASAQTKSKKPAPKGTSRRIPPPPLSSGPPQQVTPFIPPAATTAAPAPASSTKDILIQQSHPYVARNNQAQHFMDYINLAPGQERLPLTLVVTNGSDVSRNTSNSRYAWVRISIAGNRILWDNSFSQVADKQVDISGKLGPASDQIIIEAGGLPGATLSWKVTTPPVAINSSTPDKVGQGEKLTLQGQNFGPTPQDNVVTIGSKNVPVQEASPSALTLTVPEDISPGKVYVTVSVEGIKSAPHKVEVVQHVAPELSGLNIEEGPPGQPIVITGRNFGKSMGDVQVKFGDYVAGIDHASPDQLTVTVPDMPYLWDVPVTVTVKGIKSKNSLPFNVYNRVINDRQQ